MEAQSLHPLLLDVSRLVWRAWAGKLPTGIDRTCLAYVEHYRDRAQAVVQRGGWTTVLSPAASTGLFTALISPGADIKSRLIKLLAQAFVFRSRSDLSGRAYLNVGHTGLDKRSHCEWVQRSGVRAIYFVHDLIPVTHPEFCRPGHAARHRLRMQTVLAHGAGVIGNSRHTIDEFERFAREEGARSIPPSVVAPLGAMLPERPCASDRPTSRPSRPYFVFLGTIEGRKNHLLILNIWADMARRLGPSTPQLRVIGQRGWECEQVADMLDRCDALKGHVVELSRCADTELLGHVVGARALLFPSFVEGYGLPLVEALALGTPVLASNLAVFRELAGDVPQYLSPLDGLGWTHFIMDYANPDSATRAAQISRMKNWTAPRWEDHFARIDRWLPEFDASLSANSTPSG